MRRSDLPSLRTPLPVSLANIEVGKITKLNPWDYEPPECNRRRSGVFKNKLQPTFVRARHVG